MRARRLRAILLLVWSESRHEARVFTGGASLTRQFTRKLDLGAEFYGGHTVDANLGRDELQEQIGGNYEISKGLTVDFGVVAGEAVGSPRFGLQLGFSKDF